MRYSDKKGDKFYELNKSVGSAHKLSVKIAVSGTSNHSRKGSDSNGAKYNTVSNRGKSYMMPTKSSISKVNIK